MTFIGNVVWTQKQRRTQCNQKTIETNFLPAFSSLHIKLNKELIEFHFLSSIRDCLFDCEFILSFILGLIFVFNGKHGLLNTLREEWFIWQIKQQFKCFASSRVSIQGSYSLFEEKKTPEYNARNEVNMQSKIKEMQFGIRRLMTLSVCGFHVFISACVQCFLPCSVQCTRPTSKFHTEF